MSCCSVVNFELHKIVVLHLKRRLSDEKQATVRSLKAALLKAN